MVSSHAFVRMPFHWLTYITFSYLLGISMQALTESGVFSSLGLICIVTCIICYHKLRNNYLFFSIVVFFFFFLGAWRYTQQCSYHQSFQQSVEGNTYTIQGTVTDIESVPGYLSTILTLSIHQLGDIYLNDSKKIMLYTKNVEYVHIGDTIQLDKVEFKPILNTSFQYYLIKKNCSSVAFMHHPHITLLKSSTYNVWNFLHQQREKIYNSIRKKLSSKHFALIAKIFFGCKNASKYYTKKITEQGNYWGTAHYFVRAGLHLIIFLFLCNFLFQFIPLSFLSKQIIIVTWSTLYYLLSWPSIPFNRAFITFLLYKLGVIFRLQTDSLHLLTFISFVVLLLNPVQLLSLDFQLSFGLTYTLALLNRSSKYRR